MVEHSLGKGEVDSSILSSSTILSCVLNGLRAHPFAGGPINLGPWFHLGCQFPHRDAADAHSSRRPLRHARPTFVQAAAVTPAHPPPGREASLLTWPPIQWVSGFFCKRGKTCGEGALAPSQVATGLIPSAHGPSRRS